MAHISDLYCETKGHKSKLAFCIYILQSSPHALWVDNSGWDIEPIRGVVYGTEEL